MTRYFRLPFLHADPMTEIDEAEATRSGSYIEEVGDELRRYRCFFERRLGWVVYRDWADTSIPIADVKARHEGVPAEIYSPVERGPDGSVRWITCYVDAEGTVQKYIGPHYDSEGRILRKDYRDATGELRSYQEYTYRHDGEVGEVVTRSPDGAVLNVDYDG